MARTTGYKDGVQFHEALIDGWSRGFQPSQCIQELREIGYEVDEDFILMFHDNMEREMKMYYERVDKI